MMAEHEMSYIQNPMITPYLYSTIPDNLRKHAEATPSKPAFIIYPSNKERQVFTCENVFKRSREFARGLIHLGIVKTDTVSVSLPNSWEWIVSTFGIQMAGAVPLHVTCNKNDGSDIISILQLHGDCKAIIFDKGNEDLNEKLVLNIVNGENKENKITEVGSACLPSLKYIIINNKQNELKGVNFSDILKFGETHDDIVLPMLDPDDMAAYLLTSGSTGLPKLVPKSHSQMLEIGQGFVHAYGMNSQDIYFNDRPFNWAGGYPTVFIISGGTRVTTHFSLSNTINMKEACDIAVDLIRYEKCTVSQFLPLYILEMLRRNTLIFHQRVMASGGASMPKECSNVVGRFCDEFVCSYGSTEMGLLSRKIVSKSSDYSPYCVGRPLPGVEMKIVDKTGKLLQKSQIGELFVRNRSAFSGYYKNITKSSHVMGIDGWYRTDDMAYMDDNGDFYVIGRYSDIILYKDEAISPTYIEDKLRSHPFIADVCIVQITHNEGEQKVCVCVVLCENCKISTDDLKQCLSQSNERFILQFMAHSPEVVVLQSFTKTAVGKIFRRGVKEEAEKLLNNLCNKV